MKTIRVVAAIIKAINEKMSQLSLLRREDMVILQEVGSSLVAKSKKEKHHKKLSNVRLLKNWKQKLQLEN